ncbi:alpha/beta hydrolase [Metabacillus sp. GX 13764]|uniref:alpha/beta fold hydrolase n=1 Tax=Metabacillus kandeliae TaxID=2900151 RepID=UPI001E60F7D7|nr:alpha/beta hydrolase [Metabacillus kandeliae]MCD7035652.1 alpha/beta hydrolase [Metabacillus kandeliae]
MKRRPALVFLLLWLLASFIGAAGFFGTAAIDSRPAVFVSAGSILYLSVFVLLSFLVYRKNRLLWKLTITAIALLAAALVVLLLPLRDQAPQLSMLQGEKFWHMKDGTAIAYLHAAPPKRPGKYPVLFVHGGPGTPNMKGDASFFGKLARDGYDVYLYDQAGSGLSSRLDNPLQYTTQRAVDELEEIRTKIRAEKLILIGHSNGGKIAAAYMKAYPEHAEKAVLISPGPLSAEDKSGGNLKSRLNRAESLALYQELLHPRVMAAYLLLQVNPAAAKNFAGDHEMDARFINVYEKTEKTLHCNAKTGKKLQGTGFYANQAPQSAAFPAETDIKGEIAPRVPVLIFKGSCDYLSWSSAVQYKKQMPRAELVYFPHAGHNLYEDSPAAALEEIRAFLSGKKLPAAPLQSVSRPKGYEGA